MSRSWGCELSWTTRGHLPQRDMNENERGWNEMGVGNLRGSRLEDMDDVMCKNKQNADQ